MRPKGRLEAAGERDGQSGAGLGRGGLCSDRRQLSGWVLHAFGGKIRGVSWQGQPSAEEPHTAFRRAGVSRNSHCPPPRPHPL